jgi:PAS domain S-box-containing protein
MDKEPSGCTSSGPPRRPPGRFRKLLQTLNLFQNPGARRRTERELERSQALLRSVVDSALDAVVVMDASGSIALWNTAAEAMFGYSGDEAVGRPLHELITPARFRGDQRQGLAAFAGGGRGPVLGKVLELVALRRDGTEFAVELSVAPVRLPEAFYAVGVVRDVTTRKAADTEREKLRAQLAQAQKMESIGRLAGGIAHDFNNLLTVINGYSDYLLRQTRGDDAWHDGLTEIHRSGERAAALVGQLLAFSRSQLLQQQVVDANALVTGLSQMLRRLVREDIEVVPVLEAGLPTVLADRSQLEQVILTLAINARDAMPAGGQLTLATTRVWREGHCPHCHIPIQPGQYVRISVADTGPGVSDEVRQHLFEPFFTTKGVGQGSGLGLAAVQGIVVQSGGHVGVESTPGKGATFHVYLPECGARPAEQPAAATERAASSEAGTILLVEDEADVRRFLSRVLEGQGYQVVEASNGAEGLEQLEHRSADLLITDVVMPRMSGRDLAMQAVRIHPELRVLFISGYSGEILSGYQTVIPHSAFLPKPVRADILVSQVKSLINNKPLIH